MSGKHLNDISKVYLDTIANVKKAETDADIKRWEDLGGPTPGNYRADDNSAKLKEGRRLRKSDWREDLREVIDRPETEEKAEKKVDEKKGIKNKIVINPTFKEAIQEIGGELLEVNEVDSVQKTQDDTKKKQEQHKKQLEQKQKKVAAMKKLVLRKKMQAVSVGGGEDITAGYEPEGDQLDERLGGKGYKPYTSLTGKKVSGDWEDSDRGAGNKAKKRAGGKVEKKSPTYRAHVLNKEEKFTPHKMIDKKSGKAYWADTEDKHLKYKEMGYVHEAKEPKNCGCGQNPCITYGEENEKKRKNALQIQKVIGEEELLEKDLSAAERRALPNKDFALPGKGEGPEGKQRGAYPINDKKHARAALAMAAAHASPEKEAKVKAAVKKKYPEIEVSEAAGKAVGAVVKQLARIGAKKLKSKKVKKAIYKTAKKIGKAGVEGAVDAATDRAREVGKETVQNIGKKKEVEEGVLQMVKTIGRKKKPEKKAQKATDAGARARRILQQKDHETVNFLPMDEAKVDQGRSDYGKASIRNYRRSGPGHGEPAMFDPENKRGKLIDKRREEHKARRGVKGAKVPAYKVNEADDKAYNYVVSQLKKKYGDGVLTKGDKMPEPSAAQKKKNAAIRAKRAKEDHRDPTEKASDGRYSDRYSNRGSD